MHEETLFQKLSSGFPQEHAASLERACAAWQELRTAVEALLTAHERPGGVFDRSAVDPGRTVGADPGQSNPDATSDHT